MIDRNAISTIITFVGGFLMEKVKGWQGKKLGIEPKDAVQRSGIAKLFQLERKIWSTRLTSKGHGIISIAYRLKDFLDKIWTINITY